MNRPSPEAVLATLTTAVLAILAILAYVYLTTGAFGFLLGLVAAVDSGFLVSALTFVLQSPNLSVRVAKDEWDGKSVFYFVHVVVSNGSSGFLGGGIAERCWGEISVDGKGHFVPKWATRPEPIQRNYLPSPTGAQELLTVDPALIDQAKYETLLPGDQKLLDIGVKVRDDSRFFIHEPENYYESYHKRNPVDPGKHTLSLALRHGTRSSGPFEFVLEVGPDSAKADSVTLVRSK